jgi:hypothetical protein
MLGEGCPKVRLSQDRLPIFPPHLAWLLSGLLHTFGIVTFGIVTFRIVTFGIVTFGIVTFGIVTWCQSKLLSRSVPSRPVYLLLNGDLALACYTVNIDI